MLDLPFYMYVIVAFIATFILMVNYSVQTTVHRSTRNDFIIMNISGAVFAILASVAIIGHMQGMPRNTSLRNAVTNIWHTSYKDDIPIDKYDNQLYILYKFNCSDCTLIHSDLKTYLDKNDVININWISADTPEGSSFCKQYGITSVPSLLLLLPDQTAHLRNLFTPNEKLDIDHLSELLTIRQEYIDEHLPLTD